MTTWADEYLTMLDDCEKREDRLSDWERGFVDSLRRQIEQGRRPSPKQIETLDATWERATRVPAGRLPPAQLQQQRHR